MAPHKWIIALILLLSPAATVYQAAVAQSHMTLETLREKASAGDSQAQYDLGQRYLSGDEVAASASEAAKWYRRAAEQGMPDAQNALGALFTTGHGVPEDRAESLKWHRQAAELGHADAQGILGYSYEHGEGVPKNYVEAYKWYALSEVSKRNYFAKRLTPVEMEEAERLAGNWKPITQMSEANPAAEQQKYESFDEVKRADALIQEKKAQQGEGFAQGAIAGYYEVGWGVPKNNVEAYKWYIIAWRSEDSSRNSVAKKLSPAELEKAQKLARDWKPVSRKQVVTRPASDRVAGDGWKVLACTIEKFSSKIDGAPITIRFKEDGTVSFKNKELAATVNSAEVSFADGDSRITISRVTGRFIWVIRENPAFSGSCILAEKPKF